MHGAGRARSFKRRTGDGLYTDISPGFGDRKIIVAGENLTRALEPVLRETALLFQRRRTLHPNHDVAPGVGVLGSAQPVIRQPGATGESHLAVHNERLPMIAMVGATHRIPVDGPEPGELASARLQDLEYWFAQCGRANGVQQQFHRNSAAGFFGEGFRETTAYASIPENVLLHGDGTFGRFDSFQHLRKKFIAVIEESNLISGDQRHTRHSRHGDGELHTVHR
jgi:hypothetical protein